MLIWRGLSRAFYLVATENIVPDPRIQIARRDIQIVGMVAFYLVLPFAGLLTDVKFSRYCFAIFSAVLSTLLSGILGVNILLGGAHEFFRSCSVCNSIANALSLFTPLDQVATTCFLLSTILFGLDQLESASTELVSSFIWWYYWAAQLDGLINSIAGCSSPYIPYAGLVTVSIHISCMVVIIVSACVLKRWFIIYQRTDNPLLLVARVVNYARKTKYPANRSALTYWQNDYPPRMDFGKSKYGGPFSEEQVENVKTFFRLFPLLLCTQMIFIPALPIGRLHHFSSNSTHDFGECLISSTYAVNYIIAILFIPCRIALVGNKCHLWRCCSTLLKQIAIGIFLSITGKAILAGFDFYAKVSNNNTYCLFSELANATMTDVDYFPIDYRLLLVPYVVNGLGALLVIPTSLEFILAQAPLEMRGIYLGMMFTTRGIYEILGWNLIKPFQQSPWLWPSCEFYLFLLNTLIMVACLLLFMPLSYCYKLRNRDDNFNPYIAAEDYYENDFNRRDKYGSTHDNEYSSESLLLQNEAGSMVS